MRQSRVKRVVMVASAAFLLMVLLLPCTGFAAGGAGNTAQDLHKILGKWDLTGSFTSCPGYTFGGSGAWSKWTFAIHVKEAVNPDFSVGSIEFACGDLVVTGTVKALKHDYAYWSDRAGNIALAGTAEFRDVTYSFILLYDNEALHLMLFNGSWKTPWTDSTIPGAIIHQTHSLPGGPDLPVTYKAVHTGS